MERKLLLLIPYIIIACIAVTNVVKAQETILKVEPPTKEVAETGLTFELSVTITDVTDLWSWALSVSWNSTVLECTEYDEGPFMSDAVATFFVGSPPNNAIGSIPEITCTSMATSAPFGVSGSGTILTLTFLSIAEGESNITLWGELPGPDFMNSDYENIPVTVEDGQVIVIPEFPASIILPLFMITTITIVIIAKLLQSKRRRDYISAP